MSSAASKGRKHLAADALFGLVRSSFATIAEDRGGEGERSFTDALMSAFAMFSLTSPSLLAFDNQRVEGNVGTIDGIERVPCDTPMRERRDPVSPESLRPSFTSVFRQLQRGKGLEEMVFLDAYVLTWGMRGAGRTARQGISRGLQHLLASPLPRRRGTARSHPLQAENWCIIEARLR